MRDRDPDLRRTGKVYLIGAGPGDPELLTVRALKLLESADAVLHDALVSPEILALAPRDALVENVGKRCGTKRMDQEEIHARMIQLAQAGRDVVRLQGGDVLLFGRAGEEIVALALAGIEYELVPGVTAASAAAGAAGISLTDRRVAARVVFLTGHRAEESEPEIPTPPPDGATVVVYMPASTYEDLAKRFRAAGWSDETPCVIVSEASTPRQKILRATLASLPQFERLPAPALLIVGEVARVRDAHTRLFPAAFSYLEESQMVFDELTENVTADLFASSRTFT
jgi:uroporphyrin-III C-methyltransferase